MDELYNIQKNKFGEFHSYFSKFLNLLQDKQKLDNKTLYKILEFNSNMDMLITSLIDIEHDFIEGDEDYVDKLKDYNDNEKIFQHFMPLIFAYKMSLQNK